MTRNINIKLEKLISDFACLSEERQDVFITQLKNTNPSLYEALQQNDAYYHDPILNRISRCNRVNKDDALKKILYAHPAFGELKKEIYCFHIQNLGIRLEILHESEREAILQRPYTCLPFPQDWLKRFLVDKNPKIQLIHEQLLEDFQQEFGFLFKTIALKFHIDINQNLEKKKLNPEEKKLYILDMLNQDWEANQFSIINTISPVTNYIQNCINPWVYSLIKYMDEMSSSHIFYRLLGISSDNVILGSSFENPGVPIVNVFDYYNYHKHRKSIHAAMSVWQALFKPLQPFFYEYVELAQSEENIIMICIRAFMPFIIMSMVLALGYAAILPLAYHLLIEYIFFIPALYFSIVIASQYIQLKNYLYLNFIEWFYGSVYATSQYEPSHNLIHGMKTSELAQEVADYYVLCLEQCDKVERSYQQFSSPLNQHQILNRKHNLELRAQLLVEWQDLRCSATDPEQMFNIVESRLQDDKSNTKATIIQMYSVYFDLPENQKDAFEFEYLYLKEKLDRIDHLEHELVCTKQIDNEFDNRPRFHFQDV